MIDILTILKETEINLTLKGEDSLRLFQYLVQIKDAEKRGEKVDPAMVFEMLKLFTDDDDNETPIDLDRLNEVIQTVADKFKHIYWEGHTFKIKRPVTFNDPDAPIKRERSDYNFDQLIEHTCKQVMLDLGETLKKKDALIWVYRIVDAYAKGNFNKSDQGSFSHYNKVTISVFITLVFKLYEEHKRPSSGSDYSMNELYEIGRHYLKDFKE